MLRAFLLFGSYRMGMMRKPYLAVAAAALLALASVAAAQQEAAAGPTTHDYLRFVPDAGQPGGGGGGGTLQTATVTMKDGKGRTVDLIAAVHVADEKYYAG